MAGTEIVKLAKACASFWGKVETWLQVPLKQADIENCHPLVVPIHGWARRVERFPGEDINLYRNRVHNAWQNKKSSGHIKGLKEILTRFGVEEYEIHERLPQLEPDIVTILLPEGGITEDQDLLLKIFQEYGLTCRRYSQTVSEEVPIYMPATPTCHNQDNDIAVPEQNFSGSETVPLYLPVATTCHNQDTEIASI